MKEKKFKKRLVIGTVLLIIVIAVIIIIYKDSKYYTLDIFDDVSAIKVSTINQRDEYVLSSEDDINLIVQYLSSLTYRNKNIYESLCEITRGYTILPKTGYVIEIYNNKDLRQDHLIKKYVLNGQRIYIDNEEYRLTDNHTNAKSFFYNLINYLYEKDNSIKIK